MHAQSYPNRPVRFIVPFAPGGSADILARSLSQRLSEALGQSVVIDNRGGAGGAIGAELAAKSPPDGYTVLFTTNGPVTVSQSLQKIAYDPLKDLAPVTLVASLPNMLVAHPSLPVRTVGDVVALAKARPGQLTYASGGSGASNHLAAELLKHMAKVDLVHVPYKGGGPALIALITGECALLFGTMPSVIAHVKASRIKAIGVTADRRSSVLPDVPTIAESGVPGYEMTSWVGMLVPAGTSAAIVGRLREETGKAARLPEVRQRLAGEGYEIVLNTPEQMARRMSSEAAKWSEVIRAAGITAE